MSDYKNHAIFGLIMAFPFVPSLFYLFFALLGASIPDMDHENNQSKVSMMMLIGIFLSIMLYFIGGANISVLLIIFLALIFFLSRHRGFTHTVFGVIILSALFLLMIMGLLPVFTRVSSIINHTIPELLCLFLTMSVVGYFIISRRYYPLYEVVLGVYLYLSPVSYLTIDWYCVFLMLLLGSFSHIILDLFTPSGLTLLEPLSDRTFYKSLGIILLLIWVLFAINSIRLNGISFL